MMQTTKAKPAAAIEDDARTIGDAFSVVLRQATLPRVHDGYVQAAGLSGFRLERATFGILAQLAKGGRSRLSDLAQRMGMDASTVSRQVQCGEQAGLIGRQSDPSDQRAALFALTTAGEDVFSRMQTVRDARFQHALADWPAPDRHDFARLIQRFAADYLSTGRTNG